MGNQIRRGPIVFKADLAAASSNTAWPTAVTDGVAIDSDTESPGSTGERIHVKLHGTVASGTLGCTCHVYSYGIGATAIWSYIGSFNSGNSMAYDDKWGADASTLSVQETFVMSFENTARIATRVALNGTTPSFSTWVGYERE